MDSSSITVRLIRRLVAEAAIAASIGAILAGTGSFLLAPVYEAQIVLRPAQGIASNAALPQGALSIAATLTPGLLGNSADVEANVARLKSDDFLRPFVADAGILDALLDKGLIGKKDRDLGDRYPLVAADRVIAEGADRFRGKMLNVEVSPSSNIVLVSVRWQDPTLAAVWLNGLVERINRDAALRLTHKAKAHMRFLRQELDSTADIEARKAIYNLLAMQLHDLMIANVQQSAAFEVVAQAVPPARPASPQRVFLVFFGAVLGVLAWAIARASARALALLDR
jgi:uncharacterized protein involved in exopolysaccharide biosynthesis